MPQSLASPRGVSRDMSRPIVVGVDDRGRSASAVIWAAEEADRTGLPLRLVTARDHPLAPNEPLRNDLAGLARRLTLAPLKHVVSTGRPADVLLDSAPGASEIVVGRRGMSRFRRRAVGGVSLTLSALSPVPLVMVPESWVQPTLCAGPLVLGLEPPGEPDEVEGLQARTLLAFAFSRASRLRVPLVVVSASRKPDPGALRERLHPWAERYPEVELERRAVAGDPRTALVDVGAGVQLVIAGRYGGRRVPSCALGATTRWLVEFSRLPVAVIPG